MNKPWMETLAANERMRGVALSTLDNNTERGDLVSSIDINNKLVGCFNVEVVVEQVLLNPPNLHASAALVGKGFASGMSIDLLSCKALGRLVVTNSKLALFPHFS